MRIVITAASLRYVLPHCSVEQSRPILNGLCVEPCGVVVATNGQTLVAVRNGCSGATRPVILSFDEPAKVKAAKVEWLAIDVPEAYEANGRAVPLVVELFTNYGAKVGVTMAHEVEGPYPNWRQVMPPAGDCAPVPSIILGAANLQRFAESVGRKDAHRGLSFDYYAQTRAVGVRFHANDDAYGLIMPMQSKYAETSGKPSWVADSASAAPRVHDESLPESIVPAMVDASNGAAD